MRRIPWQVLVVALGFATTGTSCDDNPTAPANHSPTVLSVTAFPSAIGPTDSVVVICNAVDPDGDTLVYDWITDPRLNIRGVPAGVTSLYNTADNFHVFYPGINTPNDTAWVQCFARDRKGGSDSRIVNIIVP